HAQWDRAAPSDGGLPQRQLIALTRALRPFTERPDRCWVALWDGYGILGGGVGFNQPGHETAAEWEIVHRRIVKRAELFRRAFGRIPRIHTEHRSYLLFQGPLSAMDEGLWWTHSTHQSPNFLWPDDRAWFVATEIDGFSTYVGG